MGKKLGYSSPKSVTDMITSMMLDANGLTGKVERKSIGGVGSGLTALREGAVDMTYVTQPVWAREKDNFRLVFRSPEWAPRVMQTVGVVRTDFLKKNPQLIRGMIEARRKGVEFIKSEPGQVRQDHGEGIQGLRSRGESRHCGRAVRRRPVPTGARAISTTRA